MKKYLPRALGVALLLSACNVNKLDIPTRVGEASPIDPARADPPVTAEGEGEGEGERPTDPSAPACPGICVPTTRLTHLSRDQYASTLADALDVFVAQDSLPPDASASRFPENEGAPLGEDAVASYERAAEDVANSIVSESYASNNAAHPGERRLDVLLAPIAECGVRAEPCVAAVVDTIGQRLFRRALSDEERESLTNLYAFARAPADAQLRSGLGADFNQSLALVLEAMLLSPQLLYRVERGVEVDPADPALRKLTRTEVASRLSLTLWRSAPDAELLQADLDDPQVISVQVERLLSHPRGDRFWQQFARYLGSTDTVATIDASDIPADLRSFWSAPVAKGLARDVNRFVAQTMRDEGTVQALLTGSGGFYFDSTEKFIGKPEGIDTPTAGEWYAAGFPHRHGLLTLPGFLIANGRTSYTSAHFRGLFIQNELLCEQFRAPDDLADEIALALSGTDPSQMRTRDALDQATQGPVCQNCHAYTNPAGYALGKYDFAGHYRSEEDVAGSLVAIDTAGSLLVASAGGYPDASTCNPAEGCTPVDGEEDLTQALASNPVVHECLTDQLARLAFERAPHHADQDSDKLTSDASALEAGYVAVHSSEGNLRAALVALLTSDSMRFRRAP